MRSQDLRLARHSIASNIDLTVSLLAKVRDADDLDETERAAAARVLASLEPIHATDGLSGDERAERLSPIVSDLEQLDDAVNGPLPSDAVD